MKLPHYHRLRWTGLGPVPGCKRTERARRFLGGTDPLSADADSLAWVLIAGAQTARVRTQLSWTLRVGVGCELSCDEGEQLLYIKVERYHAKMLDHCVRDPPILCRGVLRAPDDRVLPGNGSRPTGKWRAKLVANGNRALPMGT